VLQNLQQFLKIEIALLVIRQEDNTQWQGLLEFSKDFSEIRLNNKPHQIA
jgi:hypothetical protein